MEIIKDRNFLVRMFPEAWEKSIEKMSALIRNQDFVLELVIFYNIRLLDMYLMHLKSAKYLLW